MKFEYGKASEWQFEEEVEFNTLEELMEFIKNEGSSVIISEPTVSHFDPRWKITLYDDYME